MGAPAVRKTMAVSAPRSEKDDSKAVKVNPIPRAHARRRRLSLGLVWLCFCLPGAARAGDPNPVRSVRDAIHLQAGATCLDVAVLVEHVRAWLGATEVDQDLWIDVEGSPKDPRVVTFRTGRGPYPMSQ